MTAAARRRAERRGRWSETLCVWSLRLRGWRILARDFASGRGTGAGQVDIIAARWGVLAVIEVKARDTAADALAALSGRQRRRLLRGAEAFLRHRPDLAAHDLRFDLMLVTPGRWPIHVVDAWRDGG
ncbi:MAG: YraN family protein [Rhodospirillales bacterium]|nr:YraN family protein [Rhodospirillales bacterium]